jgi:hypothetical protein
LNNPNALGNKLLEVSKGNLYGTARGGGAALGASGFRGDLEFKAL